MLFRSARSGAPYLHGSARCFFALGLGGRFDGRWRWFGGGVGVVAGHGFLRVELELEFVRVKVMAADGHAAINRQAGG